VWNLFPSRGLAPRLIKYRALILAAGGGKRRERAWVSTYMQICILNIDIDRVPTARVYCVTFDSQWRMPPPVDTAPEGRGESLGAINNPPASSSAEAR